MITIAALAKVVGVLFAMLYFGMILLPDDAYFLVVGCLTALAGMAMLFFAPPYAFVLLPIGVGLIAFGFRTRRRIERELQEEAERSSHGVARVNRLYIRTDDQDQE